MSFLILAMSRYGRVLVEVLYTLLILVGSWLVTQIADRLLRKITRVSAQDGGHLPNYIFSAVRLPVVYLIFLIGAYIALHRLPIGRRPFLYLDGVIFVVAVLLVLSLVIRSFSALLRWYQAKTQARSGTNLELEFLPLMDKLVMVLVFLIGLLTILDHFRIDIKSLLVTLGVGSLAIGLALQDTLANMFGGFAIMLDRPFRIGDFIELTGGESGHVTKIGIRSTQILNGDHNILSIPNAVLVKTMITNYSYPDTRLMLRVKLTLERGIDLPTTRKIILQSALSLQEILRDPPPEVFFTEFTDSGLAMLLLAEIGDYRQKLKLLDKLNQSLHTHLQEAGIPLASPVRTLFVRTVPDDRSTVPGQPGY